MQEQTQLTVYNASKEEAQKKGYPTFNGCNHYLVDLEVKYMNKRDLWNFVEWSSNRWSSTSINPAKSGSLLTVSTTDTINWNPTKSGSLLTVDTDAFYHTTSKKVYGIKKVIFNDPATIVFWNDGSKTVVKAHDEVFDPEKGLAMAISKKLLGNKGNYYNEFKKWLPEEDERR